MDPEQWSKEIAELVADALVDAKVIEREDFSKASEIVAEEIWVRLNMGDHPSAAKI